MVTPPVRDAEALKRAAAERAIEWVEEGMALGLGTGSTVRHLLDCIAERRAAGELRSIVAVPTSRETEARARALGIPLSDLERHPDLDLTIDGADEVDPQLRLIKGLGGALLREKVVASVSRRFVVMVDGSKLVRRLGEQCPLPVEVDPFSLPVQLAYLGRTASEARLRTARDGQPFRTDGGHVIVDCRFEHGIDAPDELELALRSRPGILETGLFLHMAEAVVVASLGEVRVLRRAPG